MKTGQLMYRACPLAEHYEQCPNFRKTCDAINCWAKFPWQMRPSNARIAAEHPVHGSQLALQRHGKLVVARRRKATTGA